MPSANPRTDVPKGQSRIAQRFIAGSFAAPRRVPKGRLKEDNGGHVQSSLRDSNGIDDVPGVETPGYSREIPSGHRSSNRANFREVLECAGRAQRRRRFRTQSQSGVALRLPPQSKKPERGQPCPPEPKFRNSRTKLSALLLSAVVTTISSFLLLCPVSAHAQGGVPLWTNVSSGAVNDLWPHALPVDSSNNIFVMGGSITKYSSTGTPLWTNGAGGNAIAVDSSGNVFVTGYSRSGSDSTSDDYATIAYSSAGVPLWTNRYDGVNSIDRPLAIAVDASGNVFVTGLSSDGSTLNEASSDFATVAYSNAGVPLWTNRYDGANTRDAAVGIAVDKSGNVFVTGHSDNGSALENGSSIDFATVAYSNAGVPLWTNRYDGPANVEDSATAIAVDSSGNGGNVFVTGKSYNPINADYATIAYSNSGVPLWTNRYNGGGSSRAIAVDNSGNVFVTGGWATVAYSSTGVKLWARLYTAGSYDPSAIAVDSSGNVFVTGKT